MGKNIDENGEMAGESSIWLPRESVLWGARERFLSFMESGTVQALSGEGAGWAGGSCTHRELQTERRTRMQVCVSVVARARMCVCGCVVVLIARLFVSLL